MKTRRRTYFERLYEEKDDPWSLRVSEYEREKYDRTLALLERRYARGLEIGCSVGVLTRRLAAQVERLLAIDISAHALARARAACGDVPNVSFARCDVTRAYPAGRFDLVVVSEVAYYWDDDDFTRTRERIAASLAPTGDVLLVHFLPTDASDAWGGDAVHEAFLRESHYDCVRAERHEGYRIDLLRARR